MKSVSVIVDGITYNIIEFDARTAINIKAMLLELVKEIPTEVSAISDLIKIFGTINPDKELALFDKLLNNVRCPLKEQKAKDKFGSSHKVSIDNFSASELMNLYELAWECLKVNFEDFKNRLKEKFDSVLGTNQGQ